MTWVPTKYPEDARRQDFVRIGRDFDAAISEWKFYRERSEHGKPGRDERRPREEDEYENERTLSTG